MAKVGGYNLLSNFNLIIPAGDSATVDASFDQWNLEISVEFKTDPNNKNISKAEVDIRSNGKDHAILIFRDWISPLGTAMSEPGYLGTSRNNNINLYFMAVHWLIGSTNRLDLQFMTREKQ